MKLAPEPLQELRPRRCKLCAPGRVGGQLAHLRAESQRLRLEVLRVLQKQDELLEARGVVDDLREVAGELRGAENVVEVLLPRA
eukprot:CAMPEP_0170275148 /NCGR_PEP_ID=MMETSP0116_2-20130129/37548_1 /TAXON_ID=400756 /ORGANISM="Durinskia baltica, Strain CSIRO CS-38" /LENGTH=83 /DNA_ID=CAMNT_0010526399 /DNA_START=98 /DNA_END=346 /DNA_ORIENTATION=+